MEPFEDIMAEADEETSLIHYNGRIVGHTIQELLNDLIPNFCFNNHTNRFLRTPEATPNSRPPMPRVLNMYLFGTKPLLSAHAAVFQLYRQFFGSQHCAAILSVLGSKHIEVVFGELSKSVELMVRIVIHFRFLMQWW
jgi:cytoplasmic FMR1 interacting protein